MAVQPECFSIPKPRGNQRLPSRIEHPSMQLLPLQASQLQFRMLPSSLKSQMIQKAAAGVNTYCSKLRRLLAKNLEKTDQLDEIFHIRMEKVNNVKHKFNMLIIAFSYGKIVDVSALLAYFKHISLFFHSFIHLFHYEVKNICLFTCFLYFNFSRSYRRRQMWLNVKLNVLGKRSLLLLQFRE